MLRKVLRILFSILFAAGIVAVTSNFSVSKPFTVKSPNGKIEVRVGLRFTQQGTFEPYYSVFFNGSKVIGKSPLGLTLKEKNIYGKKIGIKATNTEEINEKYSMVYGTHREIVNHCNQKIVTVFDTAKPENCLHIIVRVYNDGAAFRYMIEKRNTLESLNIIEENTGFLIPENAKAYALFLKNYRTSFEDNYKIITPSEIKPESLVCLPLLFEISKDLYIAITEANLTNYAGMYLSGDSDIPNLLKCNLAPMQGNPDVKVTFETPFETPWRVIMLGEKPGDLIESNIILNLNEGCKIEDPSWIKPGKTAWDWWSGSIIDEKTLEGGMNTETMKHYIDFASEFGLKYMLIDAGWYGKHNDENADITTPIEDIDIEKLIDYAKNRDVKILLWLYWKCVEKQMDQAFPLYEKWGIGGVKVDYMNRDDQKMVSFYHRVIKKAAEHYLVVDFHGAYKPTGIRRTYPNLITREGVLGLEYSKWSDKCNPEHELIIPFTRMLAGPMDFTPGGFRNKKKDEFKPQSKAPYVMGTRCHQLAMYVVYESPLQMLVDFPNAYRNEHGSDFLKIVPTTWDDTKVLYGKIGDYIVIARKSGEDWYVGGMTDWTPRDINIPLTFLDDKDYKAIIWEDSDNPYDEATRLNIKNMYLNYECTVEITMNSGGGFVMKLSPR